ncbi:12169_t:CDS:2 [Cetraspora pellucida]|uniref:12169_t:CDS:1 n=1 Tax=Cetraspora pellucida TaxID=1433469 RepID=A0ACA9JW59_9GLOM|nr:12169_t:CDS:2 [Cetraspora pellucida]
MPLETIWMCRNCFDKSHSIKILISKLESDIETRKKITNSFMQLLLK